MAQKAPSTVPVTKKTKVNGLRPFMTCDESTYQSSSVMTWITEKKALATLSKLPHVLSGARKRVQLKPAPQRWPPRTRNSSGVQLYVTSVRSRLAQRLCCASRKKLRPTMAKEKMSVPRSIATSISVGMQLTSTIISLRMPSMRPTMRNTRRLLSAMK